MQILFLSQRVPYPPNRGDKITTWKIVERLARSHSVHCIAFAHDREDEQAAAELERRGIRTQTVPFRARAAKLRSLPLLLGKRPMTLGVYGSAALQALVDQAVPKADLAYAYSSSMGAFLERHDSLPRVMHMAELDSDKWLQYSKRSSFPMRWVYAREHRTLLEFERRIAARCDTNVLCTPLEQAIFQREIPGAKSLVLRNGVDLEFYRPQPERAQADQLVFVGVMDYLPNVDGCVFFVNEILPLIRRRHPNARLAIVGSRPVQAVLDLARIPGVEVTGFVDDTRDWLAKASVSVAPLRIARGIQNKVLEAMAMGLAVVGTTSATQGVEAQAGTHFLLANSAQEQADAIVDLLDNPKRAQQLGRSARAFVEAHYDWEVVLRTLDELVASLARTT